MDVLNKPEFKSNTLLMTLWLYDKRHRLSFSVDFGFKQFFSAVLMKRRGYTIIWSVSDNRTFTGYRWPQEELHAGLRAFIASVLPELMLRGLILEGSYECAGQTWNVNPVETESIDLPDLEQVA